MINIEIRTVPVMPRLFKHDKMEYPYLIYRAGRLEHRLKIPFPVHKKHMILAYQVQIILILGYDKIILMKKPHETVKYLVCSPLLCIYEQYSAVEELISGYSHAFLDIVAELFHAQHSLFVACC